MEFEAQDWKGPPKPLSPIPALVEKNLHRQPTRFSTLTTATKYHMKKAVQYAKCEKHTRKGNAANASQTPMAGSLLCVYILRLFQEDDCNPTLQKEVRTVHSSYQPDLGEKILPALTHNNQLDSKNMGKTLHSSTQNASLGLQKGHGKNYGRVVLVLFFFCFLLHIQKRKYYQDLSPPKGKKSWIFFYTVSYF